MKQGWREPVLKSPWKWNRRGKNGIILLPQDVNLIHTIFIILNEGGLYTCSVLPTQILIFQVFFCCRAVDYLFPFGHLVWFGHCAKFFGSWLIALFHNRYKMQIESKAEKWISRSKGKVQETKPPAFLELAPSSPTTPPQPSSCSPVRYPG